MKLSFHYSEREWSVCISSFTSISFMETNAIFFGTFRMKNSSLIHNGIVWEFQKGITIEAISSMCMEFTSYVWNVILCEFQGIYGVDFEFDSLPSCNKMTHSIIFNDRYILTFDALRIYFTFYDVYDIHSLNQLLNFLRIEFSPNIVNCHWHTEEYFSTPAGIILAFTITKQMKPRWIECPLAWKGKGSRNLCVYSYKNEQFHFIPFMLLQIE